MATPRPFSEDGAFGAIDTSAPTAASSAPTTPPAGLLGMGGEYGPNGTFNPMGAQFPSPSRIPNPGLMPSSGGGAVTEAPSTVSSGGGGGGWGGPSAGGGGGAVSAAAPDTGMGHSGIPFLSGSPVGLSFSTGGAIPDDETGNGSPVQDRMAAALQSVDQVLQYTRKMHGLGGGDDESGGAIQGAGQQQAMNTAGFRQSDNVEDRRDDDPAQATAGTDPRTKMDDLTDKFKDFTASYNPMAQDAGINAIDSPANKQPAINTDEDQ